MKNPSGAILDGLAVAGEHWQLVLAILLVMVISQYLLYLALRRIFGDGLTAAEYYSLSLGGWLLPAMLISLIWYAGAAIFSSQFSTIAVLVLVSLAGLTLSFRLSKRISNESKAVAIALLLLTGLFILLRLAYASKAVLPLYFDSARHYFHINGILSTLEGTVPKTLPLATYYHLGFHFLAGFITYITHAEITDTMLVLGQIILAVMPLSVFFLVRHGTQSNSAGLCAVFLAAFGWYMPAHAVDWGKYPALASLALIPFVLGAAYLLIQNKHILSPPGFWSLNGILFGGLLVSVFLHSRSLIVFIILALTWLITTVFNKFSKLAQILLLGITILILILEIFHVQRLGILGPLFDPYGVKAVLITASVLFLSVFAYLAYPGLMFSCLVSMAFFVACLFVPLSDLIPGYANTTLLDRPYVEMILYLPLTLLGGFGLAGLEQKLAGKKLAWGNTQFELAKVIGAFFIALVTVNALFMYDPYPADCCDIVSADDVQAIGWMDENLPGDALILTSSTELKVLPTDEFQGSAGGDGGTWITPLIGRPSTLMPFNTDFNQAQIHDSLCQLQVDYIYVGGTGWGFNDQGMSVQPERYRLVFSVPKAKVYEVGGCK